MFSYRPWNMKNLLELDESEKKALFEEGLLSVGAEVHQTVFANPLPTHHPTKLNHPARTGKKKKRV